MAVPAHVFVHVGVDNFRVEAERRYSSILLELLDAMKRGGLYDYAESVSLGVVGIDDSSRAFLNQLCSENKKFSIVYSSPDLYEYEYPTLRALQAKCREGRSRVCYMHTKGSVNPLGFNQDYSDAWRRYMMYFIVEHFEKCLEKLKTRDICGVGWQKRPPHYQGNFWWARWHYIGTLPPVEILKDRQEAEFWIGRNKSARVGSLCGIRPWPIRECRPLMERRYAVYG